MWLVYLILNIIFKHSLSRYQIRNHPFRNLTFSLMYSLVSRPAPEETQRVRGE